MGVGFLQNHRFYSRKCIFDALVTYREMKRTYSYVCSESEHLQHAFDNRIFLEIKYLLILSKPRLLQYRSAYNGI